MIRTRAFIEQARAYSAGASVPDNPARPLLHYYAMLNVAKAFIEWSGISPPNKVMHGIADPKINDTAPADLTNQAVVWSGAAIDHSLVFPELLRLLSHGRTLGLNANATVPVLVLLRNIPAIHRTFRQIEGSDNTFLPINELTPVYADNQVWIRAAFPRHDRDVDKAIKALRADSRWSGFFNEVQSREENEILFESQKTWNAVRRWVERGLKQSAEECRAKVPLSAIVRPEGYWYRVQTDTEDLPVAAAMYATMFFLGSVTRYRPHHYEKLTNGKHSWLLSEFLATAQTQFTYLVASEMAGVEVLPAAASSSSAA